MNTPYQLPDDLHRRRLKWLAFRMTSFAAISMCEMFEHEVLPALRSMTSFDDFVAFASTIGRQDEFPYKVNTLERTLIAAAEGHFDRARELWDSDKRDRTYFMARAPSFYPALLAEDRTTLANIFHEWEAQTVETFKIQKAWERTPFPLECQDG